MTYSDFLISQALMSARSEKALLRRERPRQKAKRSVARKANGAKASRIAALRLQDSEVYED